jgi:ABC-type branched-subunit amino acid transport system substrate-binding protein
MSLGAPADPAALAARLRERGATDLYLLDTGPAGAALLAAAAPAGWRPRVLVPGSLAGGDLLAAARGLGGPLVLAYPTLPADRSERALEELARATAGLPPGQETAAVTALAAARLLGEGLQRAGRDLSRERLVTALEALYDHPTELTPNLTYGPNRRIGARGAYIVVLDPATGLAKSGAWMGIDQ